MLPHKALVLEMVQSYWMMWGAEELSPTCCNVPTGASLITTAFTLKMLELSAFLVVTIYPYISPTKFNMSSDIFTLVSHSQTLTRRESGESGKYWLVPAPRMRCIQWDCRIYVCDRFAWAYPASNGKWLNKFCAVTFMLPWSTMGDTTWWILSRA